MNGIFFLLLSALFIGVLIGFAYAGYIWTKYFLFLFSRTLISYIQKLWTFTKKLHHKIYDFFYVFYYRKFRLPKLKEKMRTGRLDEATWALAERLKHTDTGRTITEE